MERNRWEVVERNRGEGGNGNRRRFRGTGQQQIAGHLAAHNAVVLVPLTPHRC